MQLMLVESSGRQGSIYIRHLNAIGVPIPGCFEVVSEGQRLWAWDHITYEVLVPFVGQYVKVTDAGEISAMRNQRPPLENRREGLLEQR